MSSWQRLDPKVMLIGPIGAFRQFLLPSLVALIGIGTQQPRWLLYAAPVVILGSVGIGVLPWFTTRYRIADGQLVVTSGLVNKKRLTAPLDRIRSVDLEATLLHRLLTLQKVKVGTGVDDTMIELNALSSSGAGQLRDLLLSRRADTAAPTEAESVDASLDRPGDESDQTPHTPPHAPPLAVFSPSWARFAPFSLGRLVIALGALAGLSQFAGDIRIDLDRDRLDRILEVSLLLIVVGLVVGGLVVWTVASMLAYLVQWWDMRLVRDHGNLHLTRGLFTTASTTVEEARIRGVRLRETALLRTVGGSELHTLVTGLEESVYAVLPPCPTAVTTRVGADVLGDRTPLQARMESHGPRARRRCWVRGVRALLPLAVAVTVLALVFSWSPWLPVVTVVVAVLVGVLLGESEFTHLGHALTTDHLVAGSGVTARVRTVLQREGVIGWVVSQTWFQRRRGLATLVATTAAGAEQVVVRDLAVGTAVALADRATPGMLGEFLDDTGPRTSR